MEPEPQASSRKWRPLSSSQRRVLGVLVEKAKTTPEQYPLSLNGLTTGCNQKSNRSPQMKLTTDDVEQVLEDLRELGAAVEVQSSSRVAKYKHCLYDWLEVDKVEIAVMAELMLRGEQTVGELRGRASRMESIPDLNSLRPVLESLVNKSLVLELSPEGRGQLVTHGLYTERELADLRRRVETAGPATKSVRTASSLPEPEPMVSMEMFQELQHQVSELSNQVADLREWLEK